MITVEFSCPPIKETAEKLNKLLAAVKDAGFQLTNFELKPRTTERHEFGSPEVFVSIIGWTLSLDLLLMEAEKKK
jgi:hypothetical protein